MLKRPAVWPCIVSIFLCTTACGGSGSFSPSSAVVPVTKSLPPPDATTMATDFTNYQIRPHDVVAIEVFGAPELKREAEIDASGNLSLPLVGTVAAGGKRPQDVSAAIADRLRGRYIKDPQVTVNVIKANPMTVTVDGAVRAPGIYPINGRMTLLQAIATAKGPDQVAELDKVVVFRTVNNQRMAALFSLKQIRNGQAEDPLIVGNDIVVVGENASRRFLQDLSQFPIIGRFLPVVM